MIGRGEVLIKNALRELYPQATIKSQYPIKNLLRRDTYGTLGEVYQKHKTDLVMCDRSSCIAIEVNYNHQKMARTKDKLWQSLLQDNHVDLININSDEFPELFEGDELLPTKKQRKIVQILIEKTRKANQYNYY